MEKRTAITAPLWIKLCISALFAVLITLIAMSFTWGGMTPGQGKHTLIAAVLVLPLAVGAKLGWAEAASGLFTFLAYFALSVVAVLTLMREK